MVFTLRFRPDDTYPITISGGPLVRHFTEKDWRAFVRTQPLGEAKFYRLWLTEAKAKPNTYTTRDLK